MSRESVKSVVKKAKHWSGEVESELRCRVLFGASHTQAGGRERGRGQGQPATTSNGEIRGKTTKAGNGQGSTQQAGRTKEGKL